MIINFFLISFAGLHLRSIEDSRMTAETAAPCVQGMQVVAAGQDSVQHSQDVKSAPCSYYSSTSAVYDPEYSRMEAWLDEHPEFVNDYFLRCDIHNALYFLLLITINECCWSYRLIEYIQSAFIDIISTYFNFLLKLIINITYLIFFRKATRQTVDMWLVSHATPTSSSNSCMELSSPTHAGSSSYGTGRSGSGGSGATTPVRKISAHEFEKGGLLKPIFNTIDGTPTFLSVSPGDSGQPGGQQVSTNNTRTQRRSRHELKHLDEKDLIFELVKKLLVYIVVVILYNNFLYYVRKSHAKCQQRCLESPGVNSLTRICVTVNIVGCFIIH